MIEKVTHATTDDYSGLDIRDIRPARLVRPGLSGKWRWSRNGRLMASAEFMINGGVLVLSYSDLSQVTGGLPAIRQYIPLTWTPCKFGGARPWLRCQCGCRAALLYIRWDVFECRRCCGLVYASQRQSPALRALSRAQAIRERLGGSLDVFSPFPGRPHGMHRRSYWRLHTRGYEADLRARGAFERTLPVSSSNG